MATVSTLSSAPEAAALPDTAPEDALPPQPVRAMARTIASARAPAIHFFI